MVPGVKGLGESLSEPVWRYSTLFSVLLRIVYEALD